MINPMFLSRNYELHSTASIRIKIESKHINNRYVVVEPFVSYFPCYSGQIFNKNKLKSWFPLIIWRDPVHHGREDIQQEPEAAGHNVSAVRR